MIALAVVGISITTEALVIGSNVIVALATIALTYATSRADRHMMGRMHSEDVSLMSKLIKRIGKGSKSQP